MAIDYGSAFTKAALALPDSSWSLLRLDGGDALSNAVHARAGEFVVGAAAWQRADADPDGLVLRPLSLGNGPLQVAGVEVDPADLVAATLRHVSAEAAVLAGAPVEDVRMVVPAGWGPRRRTWWRRAAGKAGLGQVHLLEAPVAAATRLNHGVASIAVAQWLIVDVGAGCEISVVRHTPGAGFEVLATMADADAGGDRIDAALVEALCGVGVDELPADRRWALLASAQAAKHALARQAAVTMPVPGGLPVVVNTAAVRQAAQPVFERVGTLAAEAVASVDLALDRLDAVYAVGATMAVPGAEAMIAGKLGTSPLVTEPPGFVAVLGAANASPVSTTDHTHPPARGSGLPPLRRLVDLGMPGLLSLLLYAHFVFSAEFNNGRPTALGPYYYVLASWGELTVAATLALVTCLQAAALIAALLPSRPTEVTQPETGRGATISPGIGVAVAGGLAIASLYAVTAAMYFAQPVSRLLQWAVAPLLPTVACAAVLAVVAWRRRTPERGWDAFLAFPLSSSVAAAAGTFGVSGWWHGHLPDVFNGWESTLGYVGGLLVGVALACAVTRHLLARIVLAALLGFFCMIISRSGPGIVAIIYAVAVAVWWAYRTWTLFQTARAGRDR